MGQKVYAHQKVDPAIQIVQAHNHRLAAEVIQIRSNQYRYQSVGQKRRRTENPHQQSAAGIVEYHKAQSKAHSHTADGANHSAKGNDRKIPCPECTGHSVSSSAFFPISIAQFI